MEISGLHLDEADGRDACGAAVRAAQAAQVYDAGLLVLAVINIYIALGPEVRVDAGVNLSAAAVPEECAGVGNPVTGNLGGRITE